MEQNIFSRATFVTALTVLIISIFILSITSISSVIADMPPQIYDVDIVAYSGSLTQQAGTSVTYEATVKNTGVMHLSDVELGVERLDAGWFSSDGTTTLEPGQEINIVYELDIPEGEEGLHAFSLVVFAKSGVTGISNTKIVSLEVISGTTATTSTTAVQPATTIEPTTQRETETQTPSPSSEYPMLDDDLILLIAVIMIGYIVIKLLL